MRTKTNQKRHASMKLNEQLLEGLRSGDSIPVDSKFWGDLKREALAHLASRKEKQQSGRTSGI